MPYIYITLSPNRIEDGNYTVSGNVLRLEHTGGGVSKCKLAPDEDPKAAARRLLREYVKERGTFSDPINYPPFQLP
jgi:hypothetical protein